MDTENLTINSSELEDSLLLPDSFELANSDNYSSSNLLFVDSKIENYTDLVDISSDFDVFILNSQTDGVTQINNILDGYSQVESVHIISHGSSGSLELGNTTLGVDNLSLYEDSLSGWSEAITETGDILLYGCDVAKGEGITFVDALSEITGADIAASVDLTGSSDLGGDGDLEYITGDIEAELALQSKALESYESTFFNDPNFRDQLLISNLNQPISAAQLPDGRVLVLEKAGKIKIADPQNNWSTSDYMTIPRVNSGGERGSIDLALHPEFAENGYFYVYFSKDKDLPTGPGTDRRFRISRFTHNGNIASANSELKVWEDSDPWQDQAHYGGGLDFGPDGMLYLTTADEFSRDQAQILNQSGGKVIRLDVDGADIGGGWIQDGNLADNSHLIPDDNPSFAGLDADPTTPEIETDYLPEIYAYGLRNPFRARWDLPTERFFIAEVGGNDQQTAREDVHLLEEAGANFGWPQYEGISGDPNVSDPIYTYEHTGETGAVGDDTGEAIVGGFVYQGNQFPNSYNGAYFFTDFVQGWIRYLAFDSNNNVIDAQPSTSEIDAFEFADAGTVDNVSFMSELNDGSMIYLSLFSDGFGPGQLRQISYDSGNLAPTITEVSSDVTGGSNPLTVAFNSTATDPESDPLTYTWRFGDGTQATGASVSHTYTENGTYNATLVVSDTENQTTSEPISISVGGVPEASIELPLTGSSFRAGDTISYSGLAVDPDETLDGDDFSWTAELLHNGAVQPRFGPESGTSGSFTIPTTGLDYSGDTGYRIALSVTDSDGLTDTESITIRPEKVDLTFESNVPGGIQFELDDVPKADGFTIDTAINFDHEIVVPEFVTGSDGNTYAFNGWSDGFTSVTYSFSVPDVDRTYTANYIMTSDEEPDGETDGEPVGEPDGELLTSGLVLQLDAETGVNTEGNTVTSWNDQSGRGNNLTATGDPTLETGVLNGRSVISFDGDGDALQKINNITGLPRRNQDRTVFLVANYESTGYGGFAYGKNQGNRTFGLIVDGEGELNVQAWGRNDQDSGVEGTGTGWLTQSAILNSSTLNHYKDGELIDTANVNYNTELKFIRLGNEIDGSPFLDMDVAEVLVYNRALDETERQQVETYLQQKYLS